MSDEPTRDLDTRTPTVEEAALYWQWGGHMWQAPERFDRMIAKIKADALREFANEWGDGCEGFPYFPLIERADRIEEEA